MASVAVVSLELLRVCACAAALQPCGAVAVGPRRGAAPLGLLLASLLRLFAFYATRKGFSLKLSVLMPKLENCVLSCVSALWFVCLATRCMPSPSCPAASV